MLPARIGAATGDPRTTYDGSVEPRGRLPRSRLVALEGADRHVLFGRYGNVCVDDEAIRYLATGKPPRENQTCAGWADRSVSP
ncbi:alpha/beta hydrolase [Streptomyces sp. JV185]|uniref:alpha/beta hydrolase n=1 Tax=Streptomyces sp. JV185 TaxID=858638 RepID=UPI002E75FCA9|nr:alpha/beta hydrolase [Streptomyces sp. JV185]MEE1767193.1 alpha/beta hydrolase [Streptomyces sp. JV185]